MHPPYATVARVRTAFTMEGDSHRTPTGTFGGVDDAVTDVPPPRAVDHGVGDAGGAPVVGGTAVTPSSRVPHAGDGRVDGAGQGVASPRAGDGGVGRVRALAERDGVDAGSPGAAAVHKRLVTPLPLVGKLRMHMDSCPGTNKSQYFYGGLGLMLAAGLLHFAMVVYMVVGHTKFGPDLVARQIAGRFNAEDTFNHGQLVNIISNYASSGAYAEDLLHTWKAGTQELFSPISHIMSYRCFTLLADDGAVRLTLVQPPADFEPFLDPGNVYLHADVMRACDCAAERQLRSVVMPSLHRKQYRGVGERAVPAHSNAPAGDRLLPDSISSCRNVRLFTRRCVEDGYWREQAGWMRTSAVSAVNKALSSVQPYAAHPEMRKEAYGAKAKDIADQYAKFVPPQFVPDRFELPEGGCTGTSNFWKQTKLSTAQGTMQQLGQSKMSGRQGGGESPSAQKPKKVRWSSALHSQPLLTALLAPPLNGTLPKKHVEWLALAGQMPAPGNELVWDVQVLKRHAKQMAKERADIVWLGSAV